MSWASISREAEKTSTKKKCVSPPQEKGGEKIEILAEYQGPGVRGQGPAGYHTSQIRPRSIQIRPVLWLKSGQGGQKCCGADFGSRKKISGHPLGQSAWFFEIYLVAAARIPKIRKKSCVSSPAYSLRAPLWQTPIPPTKGWAPCLQPRQMPTWEPNKWRQPGSPIAATQHMGK